MRFFKIFITVIFILTAAFSVYVHFSTDTDVNGPVITCSQESISLSVKDDINVLLDYVTAADEKDGDITENIIIESISAFVGNNHSTVTYAVCDSDNNVTKLEVDIAFPDYVKPVFACSSQQVYYTGAQKVDLLSGLSAYDSLDGDVSSRITVAKSEIDLSQPGVYPVTYRVTTEKGVISEITLNAYVYDYRLSSQIELSQYLVYTNKNQKIDANSFIKDFPSEYLEDGYFSGYDCTLEIIDEVNYSAPGTYYITYRLIKQSTKTAESSEILAESYLAVVVKGDGK